MADPATTDDTAAAPPAPIAPVLFKARGRGKGKANMRKRSPSPPPPTQKDSDSDADGSSDDDNDDARGAVRDTKRRRRNNGAGVISASTEAPGQQNKTSAAWQKKPDFVTDRSALLAESELITKEEAKIDGTHTTTKTAPTPGSTAMAGVPQRAVGPVKAPTHIRTITVTDYSPDVCKDYKQTGFCGFGDSCKFLHMREDYKQGWQLDNEWEAVTKGKKNLGGTIVASASSRGKKAGGADDDDDDEDEDEALLRDIPFACIICRESYKQPIVTRCGHYFCERCALTRYRRDPSCAACGAATTGVFNTAKRLAKLLERKRQRAAKRRQAAIEAGEEPSSDEEAEDSD